jgi:hypothetical protein
MVVTIGSTTGVGPSPSPDSQLEFASPAPNPRRGKDPVLLDFILPAPDVVGIEVLDVQGRRVAARELERFDQGRHRVAWSPPVLAAGVYAIRLSTASGGSAVRRWSVLR